MSDEVSTRFDAWLGDDGPAALVLREHLVPVEGADGVVFPPTYAASDEKQGATSEQVLVKAEVENDRATLRWEKRSFRGGYNIDHFADGHNICAIDSVGSQANRMEPLFLSEPYRSLVPQIVVVAGARRVNLLEAGHRAGDAVVRCSTLAPKVREAFTDWLSRRDATALAKLAPTSLVFGVWDSRDTQAKFPRLVASAVRALDVLKVTRSAQYVPALEYAAAGLLATPEGKAESDKYAERGFAHVPASSKPGGVVAQGGIRRDATLSFSALRLLTAGDDPAKSLVLRRYILGLALVAFTSNRATYLRQGCELVADPTKPREFHAVHADGRREPDPATHADALAFAKSAAAAFGVGENREVPFEKARAEADVKPKEKADKKSGGKKSGPAEKEGSA